MMHFILCSPDFIQTPLALEPHFAATQSFVNVSTGNTNLNPLSNLTDTIPGTLDPESFTLIGILGPSLDYSLQTAKKFKAAFRLVALGANGNQGYNFLRSCLIEHTNRWRRFQYHNEVGLRRQNAVPAGSQGVRPESTERIGTSGESQALNTSDNGVFERECADH